MDNQSETFAFHHTKDYVAFLLNQKLEEASVENLRLLKEAKLPLLNLFSHLPEKELLELTKKSLADFLEQIMAGTALEKSIENIYKWRANQLPGIPREKVEVADLVFSYSLRKQLFLKFLPGYTTDCTLIVHIISELERFYLYVEKSAFQVFVEIQQESLYEKNEFLSSLIKHSVDGIVVCDRDMKVLEWNLALEKRNNIKKEDILGRSMYEVFPGYENSEEAQATLRVFNGESVYLSDRKYRAKKGWYEAFIVPLYGYTKEVVSALSIVRDITERKEIEIRLHEHKEELETANEELKEQREELSAMNEELQENLAQLEEVQEALTENQKTLVEAQAIAHVGSWEYDLERNIVHWSDEIKRIFGYDTTDFSLDYEGYLKLVHPDDREMVNETVSKTFATHESYSFEHRIVRTDSAVRWLQANGQAVVSSEGLLVKLRGTALDITDRKVAELKLKEEQYFSKKITDTTPDVITVYDLANMRNIYANKELFDILNYTQEEIEILRSKGPAALKEIIHPEDLPQLMAFFQTYTTYTGHAPREIEFRGKDGKGNWLCVMARYNVFKRSDQGLPVQIIGVSRDITERKKVEEEVKKANHLLQDTNEELVRSEEALKELNNELEERVQWRTAELSQKNEQLYRINADLDNFIYTASHDLKAPIANLEGMLLALTRKVKDKLEEKDLVLLEMMREAIGRFNNTIKDLTDIAKVQKDLEEEETEKVSFRAVVADVKSDMEKLIAETGAVIKADFSVEELDYAKKNIRSIIYNLLTNAIKYSSPERKPEINISTKAVDEFIVLSVRDNGQGIPQHQQQKIFSLFKRLHTDVEGSGIGLYIVKRIVENGGGRIEVESEVGKGTTFNIYFRSNTTLKQNKPSDLGMVKMNESDH